MQTIDCEPSIRLPAIAGPAFQDRAPLSTLRLLPRSVCPC